MSFGETDVSMVCPQLQAFTSKRNLDNSIQDCLVGVLRLESIPFSLVAVRDDHTIKVDHVVFPGGGNALLLGRCDNCVEELNLIFEDLNHLHNASISHVKRSVKGEHTGIILGISI